MTRDEASAYAVSWVDSWNERDIEAVLATFDEDIEFTSPTAVATVGVPTVTGKQALRSYWQAALAKVTSLRFTLRRIVWDPESRELAILYVSSVNGVAKCVAENLRFGQSGKVVAADVFHGVGLPVSG
ncbi:MAG TPA: nuclear transport factor 2 family protein [Polyangiaceae bacterium]|nr:nuclear transport factor 2 family protein [Polyangiaceae bacterium]